jgi:very-short-patch-repair endonuclease
VVFIPSPLYGERLGGGGEALLTDKITSIARKLRKRPTDAESLLWKHLRMEQLDGLRFRRQEPIENYIVDFVCFEKRIVIEVDGGGHDIDKEKDRKRDACLKTEGFKVLRFWNNDVLLNIEGVVEVIRESCRGTSF